MHALLMNRLDTTGSAFLLKFLGYIKKLVCKSFRFSAGKTFRNLKEAHEQTASEIARLQLVNRPVHCQMAAELLCALSPEHIKCYLVPSSCFVNDIVVDPTHTIVIMYRLSCSVYKNDVPFKIGQLRLVAAFGDRKLLDEFYFRWNCDLKFWKVTSRNHGQPYSSTKSEFKCPRWQLLVYTNVLNIDSMSNTLKQSLGGQEKMLCADHNQFLVKQSIHCAISCCVELCERNARWRCLARGNFCSHAVCFSHGRDIMRSATVVDIVQGMKGRRLPGNAKVPCVSSAMEVSDHSDCDSVEYSLSSGADSDLEMCAPVGQEDAFDSSDYPSLHSRKDVIPIYDVTRSIPGHFLWNKGYGVLRRRFDNHSSVEANSMMQHIISVSSSPCVSLLYPEAQLFPRIFWSSHETAVIGAIPSFMINCYSSTAWHHLLSITV